MGPSNLLRQSLRCLWCFHRHIAARAKAGQASGPFSSVKCRAGRPVATTLLLQAVEKRSNSLRSNARAQPIKTHINAQPMRGSLHGQRSTPELKRHPFALARPCTWYNIGGQKQGACRCAHHCRGTGVTRLPWHLCTPMRSAWLLLLATVLIAAAAQHSTSSAADVQAAARAACHLPGSDEQTTHHPQQVCGHGFCTHADCMPYRLS